jgi:hypothetical protein
MVETAPGRIAEEAFNFALEFLPPSLENALPVQSFVADCIGRQISQGDRDRLRIANRAIKAYEANHEYAASG